MKDKENELETLVIIGVLVMYVSWFAYIVFLGYSR